MWTLVKKLKCSSVSNSIGILGGQKMSSKQTKDTNINSDMESHRATRTRRQQRAWERERIKKYLKGEIPLYSNVFMDWPEHNCVKQGTLVKTKEGDKKIEDIQVGDFVMCIDRETGELAYEKVERLIRFTTGSWLHIWAGGEKIEVDLFHRFHIAGFGFMDAYCIRKGMKLVLYTGEEVEVTKIFEEFLPQRETSYNLEVEKAYFITSIGIHCR